MQMMIHECLCIHCCGNHLRCTYHSHEHFVTYQAINYVSTMVKKLSTTRLSLSIHISSICFYVVLFSFIITYQPTKTGTVSPKAHVPLLNFVGGQKHCFQNLFCVFPISPKHTSLSIFSFLLYLGHFFSLSETNLFGNTTIETHIKDIYIYIYAW